MNDENILQFILGL